MKSNLSAVASEALWDETATAGYLGVTVSMLRRGRVVGGGGYPPFLKVGRLIRYRKSDVDGWLSGRRRQSTSDAEPAA